MAKNDLMRIVIAFEFLTRTMELCSVLCFAPIDGMCPWTPTHRKLIPHKAHTLHIQCLMACSFTRCMRLPPSSMLEVFKWRSDCHLIGCEQSQKDLGGLIWIGISAFQVGDIDVSAIFLQSTSSWKASWWPTTQHPIVMEGMRCLRSSQRDGCHPNPEFCPMFDALLGQRQPAWDSGYYDLNFNNKYSPTKWVYLSCDSAETVSNDNGASLALGSQANSTPVDMVSCNSL